LLVGLLMPPVARVCVSGTEKAAPNLVRKLAKWLVGKGHDPDAGDAVE
jgi:hypothetical protein